MAVLCCGNGLADIIYQISTRESLLLRYPSHCSGKRRGFKVRTQICSLTPRKKGISIPFWVQKLCMEPARSTIASLHPENAVLQWRSWMPAFISPSSQCISAICIVLWACNITNLLPFPVACPHQGALLAGHPHSAISV